MSAPDLRDRLCAETGAATRDYYEMRTSLDARADAPPAAGDLCVFEDIDGPAVEWLVIGRGNQGRVGVVPADNYAAARNADLELPASAASGPLVLRAGLSVWLEPARLSQARRTGALEPASLRSARRWWKQTGRWRQVDVVADSELRAWLGRLVVLRRCVRASKRPTRRRRWQASPVPYAVAAALLLVTSLGFGWAWWRAVRAPQHEAIAELAYAWLSPAEVTRGGPAPVAWRESASHVLLLLEVRDSTPYSRYRLEILRGDSGAPVWGRDDLVKGGTVELPVVLRRNLLPPDSYRLRLYGLDASSATRVADYRLVVAPAGRRGD